MEEVEKFIEDALAGMSNDSLSYRDMFNKSVGAISALETIRDKINEEKSKLVEVRYHDNEEVEL